MMHSVVENVEEAWMTHTALLAAAVESRLNEVVNCSEGESDSHYEMEEEDHVEGCDIDAVENGEEEIAVCRGSHHDEEDHALDYGHDHYFVEETFGDCFGRHD